MPFSQANQLKWHLDVTRLSVECCILPTDARFNIVIYSFKSFSVFCSSPCCLCCQISRFPELYYVRRIVRIVIPLSSRVTCRFIFSSVFYTLQVADSSCLFALPSFSFRFQVAFFPLFLGISSTLLRPSPVNVICLLAPSPLHFRTVALDCVGSCSLWLKVRHPATSDPAKLAPPHCYAFPPLKFAFLKTILKYPMGYY